jgi:hypothetical protein
VLSYQLLIKKAKHNSKNPNWKITPKILIETKLPTVFTRSLKSGNDGSLLEIKEEELWVGSGYLSNEREPKAQATS